MDGPPTDPLRQRAPDHAGACLGRNCRVCVPRQTSDVAMRLRIDGVRSCAWIALLDNGRPSPRALSAAIHRPFTLGLPLNLWRL
jgi:hypothetical protein